MNFCEAHLYIGLRLMVASGAYDRVVDAEILAACLEAPVVAPNSAGALAVALDNPPGRQNLAGGFKASTRLRASVICDQLSVSGSRRQRLRQPRIMTLLLVFGPISESLRAQPLSLAARSRAPTLRHGT